MPSSKLRRVVNLLDEDYMVIRSLTCPFDRFFAGTTAATTGATGKTQKDGGGGKQSRTRPSHLGRTRSLSPPSTQQFRQCGQNRWPSSERRTQRSTSTNWRRTVASQLLNSSLGMGEAAQTFRSWGNAKTQPASTSTWSRGSEIPA
jgi:hypothetical protein